MSQRPSPPQAPRYLTRSYLSSQKGGTLIAEDVTDLATHERRLSDPDGYRPRCCPRCGHRVLHVHDYRWRVLHADPQGAAIRLVRHRCAAPQCGARWQSLPAFLPRHLWRRWPLVEAAVGGCPPPSQAPSVPPRTQRRWRDRLRSSGRLLRQVLSASGRPRLEAIAQRLGLTVSRQQVVGVLALPLWAVAALLHRLVPGLRLM
jgi:hypothetical protein